MAFTLAQVDPHAPCPYAVAFRQWGETTLLGPLGTKPMRSYLYAALLELQRRYFVWRETVPKSHRDHVSSQGHQCIWHVYDELFHLLAEMERRSTQSLLFLPASAGESRGPTVPQTTDTIFGFDATVIEKVSREIADEQ